MGRRLGKSAGVLLLLVMLGCKGMFGRQGLPPDPLFANRKPIETQGKSGPPEPLPFSEPAPAVNPYFVDQRPGSTPFLRTGTPVNGSSR